VAIGASSRDAVAPWTQRVAELGQALVADRSESIGLLSRPFAERAAELGLAGAELLYEAEPATVEALEARLDEDLDRGTTGLGPHLDDVGIGAEGRDLRRFGSQGEQRLAVLSLLLAEAELLAERGPAPPLLLLDDVLSELDERRRRALADRLAGAGQTFVTATGASALPIEPAQLVQVVPGSAR
jgi:DNA replication and repair protein RecF